MWRAKAGSLSGGSRETKLLGRERASEREIEREREFQERTSLTEARERRGGGERKRAREREVLLTMKKGLKVGKQRESSRGGKFCLGEGPVNNTRNSTAV